jgi:hypothetical protein
MTVGEQNFDVRLQFPKSIPTPGRETLVPINFLNPDLAREHIRAGQRFTLRDWRVIAEGSVTSAEFPRE